MRLPSNNPSSTEEDHSSSTDHSTLWDIPERSRNGTQRTHIIRPTPLRPHTPEPSSSSRDHHHYRHVTASSSRDNPETEPLLLRPRTDRPFSVTSVSVGGGRRGRRERTDNMGRYTSGFTPVVSINVPSVRTYTELSRHRTTNRTPPVTPNHLHNHTHPHNHLHTIASVSLPNLYNIPPGDSPYTIGSAAPLEGGVFRRGSAPASTPPRLMRNPLFNSHLEHLLISEREYLNQSDPVLARFIQPSTILSHVTTQTRDNHVLPHLPVVPTSVEVESRSHPVVTTATGGELRGEDGSPVRRSTLVSMGTQTTETSLSGCPSEDDLEFDDFLEVRRSRDREGDEDTPTPRGAPPPTATGQQGNPLVARSRTYEFSRVSSYLDSSSSSSSSGDEEEEEEEGEEGERRVRAEIVGRNGTLNCTLVFDRKNPSPPSEWDQLFKDSKVRIQLLPEMGAARTIYKERPGPSLRNVIPPPPSPLIRKVSFSNRIADVRILQDDVNGSDEEGLVVGQDNSPGGSDRTEEYDPDVPLDSGTESNSVDVPVSGALLESELCFSEDEESSESSLKQK